MSDSSAKPLITTVIPTFRRPQFLRRAVSSVLAQTYPHFEVHIYDNHSEDETAAVVQEFAAADPRVKYHSHDRNIGILENFSYAMSQVETPFFSFLSDDDFLLPEFYVKALAGFDRHPGAIFSALLTLFVDEKGELTKSQALNWENGLYEPPHGLLEFLKSGFLTWTSILFRKEIIERVGALDTTAHGYCDTNFLMRTVPRFPLVVSAQPGAVFVAHEGSRTSQPRFEDIWPGLATVIEKAKDSLEVTTQERARIARRLDQWHARMALRWCVQFTLKKDFDSARKASALLRDVYKRSFAAAGLGLAVQICRAFPPALWLARGLNRIREGIINSRIDRNKLPLAEVRKMFKLENGRTPGTKELTREYS